VTTGRAPRATRRGGRPPPPPPAPRAPPRGPAGELAYRATGELEGHPAAHRCFGCGEALLLAKEGVVGFECPHCRQAYCTACDEFLHETLHTCPGCQVPRRARGPVVNGSG
jgi:predicted RNA-binding Zn-ribbon protein involved in translation (DUF1610 family)